SGEAADKLAAGKQGEMPAGGTAHGRSIDADVTGQVDSIIGNEVVLTLGEVENGTFTAGASGETATYLLPVGMTIGSGDFSSVTSGMVLGLSLNDSGAITAVSVLSR
ncbi:MAG: hypothetical protein PHO41_11610, partial [Eubacteriales bacterium]|nr:hypothetical protein [Eubacteriales bacterium]